jgi:hypothetical protein
LSGIQGVYRNQELTERFGYNMKTYTANFYGTANQFTVYMLKDGTLVGIRSVSPATNAGRVVLQAAKFGCKSTQFCKITSKKINFLY